MVLTVTINPLLEKKLFFNSLSGKNNRAYKQDYLAGGKGINISRQLNLLDIKNHALTFLGGASGKKLRSILENEGISFSAVSTKSETREATLIFDESKNELNSYFGINSFVSNKEIEQFVSKLEKAINNSSIVVFAGSLPNLETSIIYEKGIELCHKHDKIVILDSYGEKLSYFIDLAPTIIHNNLEEIKASLKFDVGNEEEITNVLDVLYNKNVKLAFLTDGKNESFVSKSDFHYKINIPKIIEKDSTGSGDAFVAGIIYGLEKSLVFNDFVTFASALGSQNAASWDTCKVEFKEADMLTDEISISEIGKKIKLIDDSPTI